MNVMKFITAMLSIVVMLLIAGCGGGDDGGSTSSSVPVLGKVFLERTGNTSIKITWQEATDSLTSPEAMGYEIYLSQIENFTPDASTLYTTVFGVTETEIFNLQVDQTYYVLVIAVNRAGQQSRERDYQAVTLNDTPPPTQQIIHVTDLQTDLGLMIINTELPELITVHGTKNQQGELISITDFIHMITDPTSPGKYKSIQYHFDGDTVELTLVDSEEEEEQKLIRIIRKQPKVIGMSLATKNTSTGQETILTEVNEATLQEPFNIDPNQNFNDPNCDFGDAIAAYIKAEAFGMINKMMGLFCDATSLMTGGAAKAAIDISIAIADFTEAQKGSGRSFCSPMAVPTQNCPSKPEKDFNNMLDKLGLIDKFANLPVAECSKKNWLSYGCIDSLSGVVENTEKVINPEEECEPAEENESFSDWCEPDGPRSGVRGDPHLYTFDRLSLDFQAVGEFTFVKSTIPNDSFEVQTRLAPVGDRNDVSVVQAVAVNVEGDRVGFYRGQDPITYINGTPTPLTNEVIYLPNGGRVGIDGSTYKVGWPNGAVVGLRGTTLTIYLTQEQQNKVIGILGNADGISQNDIFTRLGNNLGTNPDFYTFYKEYANSWRISQNESLFDYAEGETTETFTIENYPRTLVRASDLDAATRATAAQICRDAGITDPVFLEDCILDVALTGDPTFAENPDSLSPALSANVVPPLPPQAGTIGFSQLSGLIYNAVTKNPINNAQVNLTTNGLPLIGVTAKFTNDGKYQTDIVPTGSGYQLDITSTDYIAEKVFNLTTLDAQTKTVELIRLVPSSYQGQTGTVKGTVKNATDNKAIAGLNVRVRRYINNRIGDAIQETQTDSSGKFRLNNLESGNYTIELQGGEFATNYVTAVSIGNKTTEIEAFMSPALGDALYRAVLTWGNLNNTLADLDAHLTGPDGQGERFHIYFNTPGSGKNDEPPYAWLDRDDRKGIGPESITLFKLQAGGVYRYSVHNYAHSAMTYSEVLGNSGAKVDVYSQRGLEASFNIPQQEGTLWTVFEIDELGSIVPVNAMGYEVNQGGLPWWSLSTDKLSIQRSRREPETDYRAIVFQPEKK